MSTARSWVLPSQGRTVNPPSGVPRLLYGVDPTGSGYNVEPLGDLGAGARGQVRYPSISIEDHLAIWGPMPDVSKRGRDHALAEISKSGLRGRGGAWFPVTRKWEAAMQGRRRPVMVANASEGEPASAKDATLLSRTPHLFLDGAMFAAATVGASRLICFVPGHLVTHITLALSERTRRGLNTVDTEVVAAPERYVTGEESSAVNYLNGGPSGTPTFTRIRPVYRYGIAGGPTIVQNAETLTHAGLIARFGSAWYRSIGTDQAPGSILLTLTGAMKVPRVVEVPVGTTLRSAITTAGGVDARFSGVLLGGYGGSWLSAAKLLDLPLSPEALSSQGATLGPGVVFMLPEGTCAVAQLAGLARWMANQGAGQCGPCIQGLPAMAAGLEAIVALRAKRDTVERILQVCRLVEGRGACRHPDGVARMIRSGIEVFRDDIETHVHGKKCGLRPNFILPTRSISGPSR